MSGNNMSEDEIVTALRVHACLMRTTLLRRRALRVWEGGR